MELNASKRPGLIKARAVINSLTFSRTHSTLIINKDLYDAGGNLKMLFARCQIAFTITLELIFVNSNVNLF